MKISALLTIFLALPTLCSAALFIVPNTSGDYYDTPKVYLWQERDTGKTVETTVSNNLESLIAWTELTDSDPVYADKSYDEHLLQQLEDISLNGTATQVIPQNTTYTDPGASAVDAVNGQGVSLTSAIVKTLNNGQAGTVNTANLGTQTITYTVTDTPPAGSGQAALTSAVSRSVTVVPAHLYVPNEVQALDYTPYGKMRTDTKTNVPGTTSTRDEQLKAFGKQYDASSSLTYSKARYYNQDTGLFTTPDPVSQNIGVSSLTETLLLDPQQQNTFSYARNNPLVFIDPFGLNSSRSSISLPSISLFGAGSSYSPGAFGIYGQIANGVQKNVVQPAKQGVSTVADFVPMLSNAKGVAQFVTGVDSITGQPVGKGTAFMAVMFGGTTAKAGKYAGGAYRAVRGVLGREAHHIISDAISPFSRGDGPAISMDKADHFLTSSWGNKPGASAYREAQRELVESGNVVGAFEMEATNLVKFFGDKYRDAVNQARQTMQNLLNI